MNCHVMRQHFDSWPNSSHQPVAVCNDCHLPHNPVGKWVTKTDNGFFHSLAFTLENFHEPIPDQTKELMERSAEAMTDMLDAIREAQSAGVSEADLTQIFDCQKKAMWRLDYISSENSMGFHASQEASRTLGESIDFSRRAQALALRLRALEAPEVDLPVEPVEGVTPTEKAPKGRPD